MLIVTDNGEEMVNAEQAFAYSLVRDAKVGFAVVVFSGPVRTVLAAGQEQRCRRALELIQHSAKERWHILDLHTELGPRPSLDIAVPAIVLPGNGEGRAM